MSTLTHDGGGVRPPASTRVLRRALAGMDRHYRAGDTPTVRHLLGPLGAEAPALGAALLALPFLSPLSLGPLTTAGSVLILLLGLKLLGRREDAALPERLLNISVPRVTHRVMRAVLRRVIRWTRRLSRPRHAHLVDGRRGRVLCGTGVVAGALLLGVPVPLLPLTNTIPAFGILCFTLGWSERDGLLTMVGWGSLALSALYFVGLGVAGTLLGWEAVRGLLPFAGGAR